MKSEYLKHKTNTLKNSNTLKPSVTEQSVRSTRGVSMKKELAPGCRRRIVTKVQKLVPHNAKTPTPKTKVALWSDRASR